MLILCPDCKKPVSRDVHFCPKCGCDFARHEESEFVEYKQKKLSVMSIISCIMIPLYSMISIVNLILAVTGNHNSLIVYDILMGLTLLFQLSFAIIPLKKEIFYKTPSVIGIIFGVIGLFLALTVNIIMLILMGYGI